MWLGGDRISNALVTDQRMTSGPGGQLMIGYKIADVWDISLAGDVQTMITSVTQLQGGMLKTDLNHQHVDLEAGYSQGGWWRVNAGVRVMHYLQTAVYNVPAFSGYDQREMYGIGPKLGFGARVGFSPQWAVVGGLNGALVYTSFADTGSGTISGLGAYWQLVPQVGAELGANWRSPEKPSFSITVGGRIDASFNTAIVADGSRRGTLLEFGPFVRAAYNFAGPARVRHPAVSTDAEAPAKLAGRPVYFDFDRADISPVAISVIRQAVAEARLGRPVSLRITGQADGAGDETYNKALALRRTNAVKDELKRQGLDSSQIAAVAISH
jgi:hypothetical protein